MDKVARPPAQQRSELFSETATQKGTTPPSCGSPFIRVRGVLTLLDLLLLLQRQFSAADKAGFCHSDHSLCYRGIYQFVRDPPFRREPRLPA